MADLITYPNKSTGDQYTATEANEVKTVVNNNAIETDDNAVAIQDNTDNIAINASDIADNTANFLDLNEQAVQSNLVEANISGTYELDLSASRMWLLTLTADTTIDVSAIPFSKSVAFTVKLTGNFVPTLSGVNVYGDDYDGTVQNLISFVGYTLAGDVQVVDAIISNLA